MPKICISINYHSCYFILFYFSRSSDSSTPRPGSQGNRGSGTGSSAANSNSPTTPATTALSSSVRVEHNNFINHDSNLFYKFLIFCIHFKQAPQAPKKTTTASSRRNGQGDESSGGATASGTGGQKVLLSDLQNFLSGLQASNDGNAASGRTVDLASAINAEALDKINTEAEQSKFIKKHILGNTKNKLLLN